MVRSSHPGRRGVRGRAQRRSRCQASCPPASLCLTPAHPHPRSPAETPAAPALRRPRAHSPASPAESRPPRRVVALSWPAGQAAVALAASQGANHTSAGASLASELPQEAIGIAALRLGSRALCAPVLRSGAARAAEATAQGRARPGALARAGLRRADASETPVIPEAFAPKSFGSAAEPVEAGVRRRLTVPGGVWEAERRAQREPGSAQRGGAKTPAAAAAAPWRGARGF
ncbi:putative HTLV-1-related endogenous sequence [Myotis myotis]|uniref:putative HTLV-1-related endogenous sequence n=1 Tax=Myotis myotis TaxID=51298 RepID=UPI00174D5603|nr:putative HTLV-1-related endogenous sequence [Myotis myotis]